MIVPPDTNSKWEMVFAFQIISNIRNGWMFPVLIIIVVGYMFIKLVLLAFTRIVEIYKTWVFDHNYKNTVASYILRAAAIWVASFWLVAALLIFNYGMVWAGLDLFSCSTLVFVVVSTIVDWHQENKEEQEMPLLEDVSLADIVSWHKEVQGVREQRKEDPL